MGVKLLMLFLLFTFSMAWSADVNGCPFVQPFYGRVECTSLAGQAVNDYPKAYWGEYQGTMAITEQCGNDENSPNCQYFFMCESVGTDVTGNPDCQLNKVIYRVCNGIDTNFNCNLNPTPWIEKLIFLQPGETKLLTDIPLSAGQFIQAYTFINAFSSSGVVKPHLLSKYTPYGLNVIESGAKYRYNAKSCNVNNGANYELPPGISVAPPTGGSFDASKILQNCPSNMQCKISPNQNLAFDDWTNYLSTYVYVPTDINNKIVSYGGQQSYCQPAPAGANILSIEQFKTNGGCYTTPTKIAATVSCCPGQEAANQRCGDDFAWHPIVTGECDASRACQSGYSCQNNLCVRQATCFSDLQCSGQGSYTADYSVSSPTIIKYGCVQGQCQIMDRKAVACTPPNVGCSAGTVCDPSAYVCIKQQGTGTFVNPAFSFDRLIGNFLKAAFISGIIAILLYFIPFTRKFVSGIFPMNPVGIAGFIIVLSLVIMFIGGGFG